MRGKGGVGGRRGKRGVGGWGESSWGDFCSHNYSISVVGCDKKQLDFDAQCLIQKRKKKTYNLSTSKLRQ